MDGTQTSYTETPTAPVMTAADIDFELKAGPWPTPADLPYEDVYERLTDVLIERDSYRMLAQELMRALHDLDERHNRQQARYLELRDECMRLRRPRVAA